ncbi:hypothetical protein APHNYW_1491 [Anaplasma phagocytophilum str. ApNYW]|nr:hypothetical protein APHWEB_0569 [Anaplasma phagocytophilum str. Webster]KJV86310.1 hypothetical protein APHNYW_1491 [Anaplasma phagocytophilum str. ApNYW]
MLLLQSITVYHTCSDITKDSYSTHKSGHGSGGMPLYF